MMPSIAVLTLISLAAISRGRRRACRLLLPLLLAIWTT